PKPCSMSMPTTARRSQPTPGSASSVAPQMSHTLAPFICQCHDRAMTAHIMGPTHAVGQAETSAPEPSGPEARSLTSARPRSSKGQFVRVVPATKVPVDLHALAEDRFLDREISWLQFNERVLELAEDDTEPLLERARYLAIFASNLDEFFMVRVAGLKRRIATGLAVRSASGHEPREVLEQISLVAHELMARHARVFEDQIRPALVEEGITIVRWDELNDGEQE